MPYIGGFIVAGVGGGLGGLRIARGRPAQAEKRSSDGPQIPAMKTVPVTGSGPDGRVELTDIRAKLGEIQGEVDETVERRQARGPYVAVGGVVLLVVLAFLLGRAAGATEVDVGRDPADVKRHAGVWPCVRRDAPWIRPRAPRG